MNIKDSYIHNGEAILKDILVSGSKLQKLKAGKDANDAYLTWVDVLDLSPFGASGHNHDDRYLKLSGGTLTGLLTTTYGNNHSGIKVGNTYINAINGELIFLNNSTIRFGGDSWNYDVWAGLKYIHASKTICLGLADGSVFTANNAQSGGKLYLPGIDNLYTGNGTNLVWHTGNDGSGSGLDADLLDGKHATDFATAGHTHSNYLERLAWWNESDSHNVDNLSTGTTFAYKSHNAPTYGTIVAFSCTGGTYQLLLQGQYNGENLWFRNKNGDNYTWNTWRYIIHSGNIGSQSVSSATYASNIGSSGIAGTNYVTAAKVISACNWYDTMIGSDSDKVINRWSEIVAFVAGFKETPDLATFLSNNYLAKAGGTMTGPLKWKDQNALPQQTSPQYFLCIDAFADGGTTRWAGKADTLKTLTGLTSTAIGDSDEPVYWNGAKFVKAGAYPTKSSWNYDDKYLKLSGGTLTGSKNVLTLSNNSGGDIGLKFSRNTNTSWEIIDTGGNLKFNELFSNTTRLVLYENSQGGSAVFKGRVSATGFSKLNSSDSYLLLGGGGHKAVSDFAAISDLNNYVLKKPDTHFYNYIGCNKLSNWYKITFPFHNTTSTNNRWMMVSMELILKGNYSNGADGTIYLSYYIYYPANNNIGSADKVYALAIGSNMNDVRIAYNKTDLGILYVYVPNNYNSFAIQNLSANDTAPSYDFTTTTIDALSSSNYPANSTILDINIRKLYTTNGTSLLLNGNVLIDAGNIGSQSVSNARNLLGRTTTGSDYGAVDGNLVFAEWSTYSDNRWYLKAKGYETRVGYANNSDKLDGQDLITQVSDWNIDSLSIFKSSENSSSNAPTTDFLYGLTLRFHRNDSTYHTDLVSKLYSDALFFRRKTESGYGEWRELIHSGNISSQSVNYATNAGYATSTGNADTVDNMHASTLLHLDGYYSIPGNNTNSSTKLWSKIGSITFTEAWQQCGASLTFYEWEARYMMGELKFNIRTSSSKSNASADIVWMNLTNKKFENSFIICRTGNGTYDIYFEYPAISYINIKFYIISQYDNGYITWQNGSALTSIEPTYVNEKFVSSLNSWVGNANYATEAGTAASANSVAWSGITDKPTFITWSEISSTSSYSLSNAAWTNTITLPTTAGSYILNIVSGNSTLTGVFSIGSSDNAKDEISLHLHGNGPRLYARTNGTTLLLSSSDTNATSRSVTIKYRRMI